jgi:hypothetical protein
MFNANFLTRWSQCAWKRLEFIFRMFKRRMYNTQTINIRNPHVVPYTQTPIVVHYTFAISRSIIPHPFRFQHYILNPHANFSKILKISLTVQDSLARPTWRYYHIHQYHINTYIAGRSQLFLYKFIRKIINTFHLRPMQTSKLHHTDVVLYSTSYAYRFIIRATVDFAGSCIIILPDNSFYNLWTNYICVCLLYELFRSAYFNYILFSS